MHRPVCCSPSARAGFFLHADDFDERYAQLMANGVEFVTTPRSEPDGRFAVFLDVAGTRWVLFGPPESQ